MHSEQPLLTIGIPTWNRAKELQECIRSAAAQIETVGEDVEIFVSDNASTDGTEELLHALASQFGFLRYSRNQTNLGPDLNFLEVFKKASGRYVWLFSDDDFLLDGALKTVLKVIRAHRPCYISTNYRCVDSRRRVVEKRNLQHHMVTHDIPGVDANQMFLKRNHWLSFMSCNVYRKDVLDIPDYEKNLDRMRNWIQVYMIAQVLSTRPGGYLSSCYAVGQRINNNSIGPDVFLKNMPEAFDYIASRFNLDRQVRKQLMLGIRKTFLPFKSFVRRRAFNAEVEISPLLIPGYYKLGLLIPSFLVRLAWKTKRCLWGKGFSSPQNIK